MPILRACSAPGCTTLTFGPFCVEHEEIEAHVLGKSPKTVTAPPSPGPPPLERKK